MIRSRGFITGGYLYAGVALLVAGLSLACYALYQRGNAASARADAAEAKVSQLAQALQEGEAQIEALRVAAEVLDRQLVEIHRRERVLNDQKRRLQRELSELAKSLPKEDQDCLGRDLPDAIAERLLNAAHSANKGGEATSPRESSGPVR